jgi:hypothetical protein
VQERLKCRMRYGRPHVLVRWAGRDASGDTRESLERPTTCEAAIVDFQQATGRALPRPAPLPPTAAVDRVHCRRGPSGRPGDGARGPEGALLVHGARISDLSAHFLVPLLWPAQ